MENKQTPINAEVVRGRLAASGLKDLAQASIREIKKLVDQIEAASGEKFVRMEMGIPGLPALQVGVDAQIQALKDGVAAIYPDIQGTAPLKREIARFAKLYLDLEVNPEYCIPTVGSMMGGMACFLTVNRMWADREGTLFLDPGFPVQKQQCKLLGHGYRSFDMYDFRGPKLRAKLESCLKDGKVSSILYSSPNNPSWICLTEEELRTIGELATQYGVVVIEDLAYFGMDFRKDYGKPGQPPYQPTVAKYTDNYILLISSSKAFSYAGERIGAMLVGEKVWTMRSPDLRRYYNSDQFGYALLFGTIYALSSGTSHSAQCALAAMLKAVNDGEVDFVAITREYGEKAKVMKRLFVENGFQIVYDRDLEQPVADGFYFTFAYPGLTGGQLLNELLRYGVSAITLDTTGSERTEGLRACTSLIPRAQFPLLETRLRQFREDHPRKA
ncbi:MAG: pyridoxal phosphate-dependent aminotransferase [Holophaga sp.]|nr:pyridoxal phosphate-dependent aminotransferase [Holophaga sp.]